MTILIEALTFETIIGILPHERHAPQPIIVDIKAEYTYDTEHFVDYAHMVQKVQEIFIQGEFGLLEEALEVIHTTLLESFEMIEHLSIRVRKSTILPNCIVGVELNKGRT